MVIKKKKKHLSLQENKWLQENSGGDHFVRIYIENIKRKSKENESENLRQYFVGNYR